MDHFSRLNYSESALLFEQVVDIDPEAGISRALAIACNLELGDTNKATRLAKGFKDPIFRWAKWVTAKAELESGAISNATFIAANLTTNFPSMRMLPDRGSHIWRKLDWNLFEQLTASNGVSTSFDDH
jgi:hypothetical protein